jgi:aryl-alcohol dehydrogenase-like predicted oxidoreductase
MKLRPLGTTGLEVSDLCMGTMQFGWTTDEPSSFAVLDAYVGAGGNFIDTADIYSTWAAGNPGGVSEAILGRWMKARGNRGKLVVATKVRGKMWDGPDGEGLGRAHILRSVDESLRRLAIDTIDLYQCHWPDEATPIEETLKVLGELIAAGKVRAIGASNYSAAQLSAALAAAEANGLPRFGSLQPLFNLVRRDRFGADLADLCRREGIGVIPYSPLAGGWLTGKYRRGQPLPESKRADAKERYQNDAGYGVVETLDTIASARGATLPAVALAWLLAQPVITSPILGANTPEQLAALLPGSDLALSAEEMATLEAASVRTLG